MFVEAGGLRLHGVLRTCRSQPGCKVARCSRHARRASHPRTRSAAVITCELSYSMQSTFAFASSPTQLAVGSAAALLGLVLAVRYLESPWLASLMKRMTRRDSPGASFGSSRPKLVLQLILQSAVQVEQYRLRKGENVLQFDSYEELCYVAKTALQRGGAGSRISGVYRMSDDQVEQLRVPTYDRLEGDTSTYASASQDPNDLWTEYILRDAFSDVDAAWKSFSERNLLRVEVDDASRTSSSPTCRLCNGTGKTVCSRCRGASKPKGASTARSARPLCDVCNASGQVNCAWCNSEPPTPS
ncbi:hypothetical protein FVE85_3062 [Porphyridium purpureum]|uniref:Uncharacterized protein n=1 Tax=Porphyridium purpureum TaxID=35688 RepID=A0A5J4YTI1_PORPP|nr:hypothetical protein FVE85_3062 [Porphyridium purpureum]|eukprot:POR7917..scf227_4